MGAKNAATWFRAMADRIIVPTVRDVAAWRIAAELCVKTGGLSGDFDWPQVVISLCREWDNTNRKKKARDIVS